MLCVSVDTILLIQGIGGGESNADKGVRNSSEIRGFLEGCGQNLSLYRNGPRRER